MADSPSAPRLLLLAGDVRANLGDRAIRAALIQQIRRIWPGARVSILSKTPDRDRREFAADILGPNALSLVWRAREIRAMDLVVWGGGQLLQDDSSLVKNLYWATVLLWVRRGLGRPVVGLGVGIGPLRTRPGRFLAARALSGLSRFVGRDPTSCEWARTLGPRDLRVDQAPDPVVLLGPADRDEALDHLRRQAGIEPAPGELWVGVNVRQWFHLGSRRILPYARKAARAQGDPRFLRFLDNLAVAMRNAFGDVQVRLLFFPMVNWEGERDSRWGARLAERAGLPVTMVPLDGDATLAKALAGLCDLFVSVRMHAALLALSMGVPSVAFPHVPKVTELFQAFGQGDRTLDIAAAAAPDGAARMEAMIRALLRDRERVREALHDAGPDPESAARPYREALQSGLGSGPT